MAAVLTGVASFALPGYGAVLCVDVASTNPITPFKDWSYAATSIQQAVDVAVDGDTVLVARGTYVLDAGVVITNGITVVGAAGRLNTTVDGNQSVQCFRVDHSNAVLEGFTMVSGRGDEGGGLYVRGGIVRQCTLASNISQRAGGGAYCAQSALLSECDVLANSTIAGHGGGIYCSGGSSISRCTVIGNTAFRTLYSGYNGGGIFCHENGRITDCTILQNNAYGAGGVLCKESTMERCAVEGNSAKGAGGVILGGPGGVARSCAVRGNSNVGISTEADTLVEGCEISGNYGYWGGGISAGGGLVTNCVFAGNSTGNNGGGGVASLSTVFASCIFTGNSASSSGGGIYGGTLRHCLLTANESRYGGGAAFSDLWNCRIVANNSLENIGGVGGGTLHGCLVAANTSKFTAAGLGYVTAYNCTVVGNVAQFNYPMHGYAPVSAWNSIFSSDTAGGMPEIYTGEYFYCCLESNPAIGTGNVSADPLFIDVASGDYRVQSNSPCVNAGTNQVWMVGTTDLAGSNRIQNGHVDIGAYESPYWNNAMDWDQDGLGEVDELGLGCNPDNADSDGDRISDGGEITSGTSPTDDVDYLGFRVVSFAADGCVFEWPSHTGRVYDIAASSDIFGTNWLPVAIGVGGVEGTLCITAAPPDGLSFFRIAVRQP